MEELQKNEGRLTIPTDDSFVEGTKKYIKMWGADAVRDCDGTELPSNAGDLCKKVYKTYFISRGDNDFAYSHNEFMSHMGLISERVTATASTIEIDIMKGFFSPQIKPDFDEGKQYWQVFDRTIGKEVYDWDFDGTNIVTVKNAEKYHEYTVNFFAYHLWNPTQIYNYTCNNWTKTKDRDYDLIFPEVFDHVVDNLKNWMTENPQVNVLRFTTFLYHFFLLYKSGRENKLFDWYNYATAASPEMFKKFKEEYGYEITLEDIVTAGDYSSQFKIPSKTYIDFCDLVQKFVSVTMGKIIDVVHSFNREAMMFWGDNWVGAEPYGKYFHLMNLDGVVGSVSSGVTVRMVADIPNIKCREIRLMPYFFPDTLYDDKIATETLLNYWVMERRAIMRKPVDRVGFGGYLKIADKYQLFCNAVKNLADEFREIYNNIDNKEPYSPVKVSIISYYGKEKSWMTNMFSQSASTPSNSGYMGFLECLCGLPVDISFNSFDDVINGNIKDVDILINMGHMGTSFSGGECWDDKKLIEAVRKFVCEGGGFIGVGEPTAFEKQGRIFQLADILGVDEERPSTTMMGRFNNEISKDHFILKDKVKSIDYAGFDFYTYALDDATVLDVSDEGYGKTSVKIACTNFGKGRGIYIAGLNFDMNNTRILQRSLLWASHKENLLEKAFSSNINVECHYYKDTNKYALINNSDKQQNTIFYDIDGKNKNITLNPYEIKWF